MKVRIGKYRSWIGPYQLADMLQYVGLSEDRCHAIGEWLAETWLNTACEWLDSKKNRAVKIHIDDYDVWSMDSTLAYIILPMLKKLEQMKHGSPITDDADVPEAVRSTAAPAKKNEWDTDDFFFQRWDFILSEMIWAFEQIHPDNDWEDQYFTPTFNMEGHDKHNQRIENGLRLFGKYFRALWD